MRSLATRLRKSSSFLAGSELASLGNLAPASGPTSAWQGRHCRLAVGHRPGVEDPFSRPLFL